MIKLFLIFIFGMGLGFFYFSGLWLTVRRLPGSRRPLSLALTSFLVRFGLSVVLMLAVCKQDWRSWLACMFGFMSSKLISAEFVKRKRRQKKLK